jgi:hypothetical protein
MFLLVATAVWAFAQGSAKPEQITKGPIVESTTPNSAKIAWSTNAGGSSIIQYGTSPSNLSQTAESAYEQGGGTHRVTLNNLQPNTTYYFRVISGQGSGTGTQAQSAVGQFRTSGGGATSQGVSMQMPASGQQSGALSGGPTLESVTQNSAKVAWSSTGGNHVVHYGTNPSALNQTAQSPYGQAGGTQRATLSGLQPNTTYYYVVTNPQGQPVSQMGQFTTANENTTRIPLYRSRGPNGSHLFTTSFPEQQSAKQSGYTAEGITGYIEKNAGPGDVPLYRLRGSNGDHFYTTNASEAQNAAANLHYTNEGTVGYVATAPEAGTAPLYRLYNPNTGQHFYTTNAGERQQLLSSGWQDNGVVGYVWNQ